MYVVTYKNKVVLSNTTWSKSFIEKSFLIRFRVKIDDVPYSQPDLPYTINDEIKIFPAEEIKPDFDYMIEYLEGPNWVIESDVAYANYTKKDLPIESARQHFRNLAMNERYKKEISGVNYEIDGTSVWIDTTREGRQIYIHQLLLMNEDQSINWKFNTGWKTLTKPELESIVLIGRQHVQDAFDWEKSINSMIDDAQTKEELLEIQIIEEDEPEDVIQN